MDEILVLSWRFYRNNLDRELVYNNSKGQKLQKLLITIFNNKAIL